MENLTPVIRRLDTGDAPALERFYNHLTSASKRTFRPLGERTDIAACEDIVRGNAPPAVVKYDLVAWAADEIVGWSFIWRLDEREPFFGLAVADAWHGRGLGARLMDGVLAWADAGGLPLVVLTVVQDNERAGNMYRRRGFVRTGEFIGPEDGLPYFRMGRRRP